MKPYNKIPLSITNGLNRQAIGTAGGYIQLLDSSPGANVQIHLNEQNADGIPLKDYHAIEADGVDKIFVSADAIDGGSITILQSTKKQFKLITPASDINVDEIGSYSDVALTALEKIFNPYQTPISTHSSTAITGTVLSKTLTCDKIELLISHLCATDTRVSWGKFKIYIDSILILSNEILYDASYRGVNNPIKHTINNTNGKVLTIDTYSAYSTYNNFILDEYTLKP